MNQIWLSALLSLPLAAQLPSPNPEGVRMGHLHINTRDTAAQKKFWGDLMGGKPGKLANMDFFKFPGVIVLLRDRDANGGTQGSTVHHLGFMVPDLAAFAAKVKASGFPIVRELPATKQIFVMAPGDIQVEISEEQGMAGPMAHHHVHFYTPDLEQTRAWYVKMFGAVPGKRGKFEAADIPGANLSFSKSQAAVAPTQGRSMDHIGFDVANLSEFAQKLAQNGVKFDVPVREVPNLNLKIAFLTDPWGTYIELTEGLDKL